MGTPEGRGGSREGAHVKGVHGDIAAISQRGLLVRTENGAIEFPYEAESCSFYCKPPSCFYWGLAEPTADAAAAGAVDA